MALSAPQPLDEDNVNWEIDGIYYEEPYEYKESVKKVTKRLIEQVKNEKIIFDEISVEEATEIIE